MTALQWKLKGFIGVEALTDRLLAQLENDEGDTDEALLNVADFMIVLMEVQYEPEEGSLPLAVFEEEYTPFLKQLLIDANSQVQQRRTEIGAKVLQFWGRVVARSRDASDVMPNDSNTESSPVKDTIQK